MSEDTKIGGGSGRFPTTHGSAVAGARSDDAAERQRSFEALVAAYWKPVYKYVRIQWRKSNEDAKDLTQGFFLAVMEKGYLRPYDPAKGRFRTFLRACLDGYLANRHRAETRLKRGGAAVLLSLDFETAEGELSAIDVPSPDSPDRYFEQEWVRGLLGLAVQALREECAARGRDVTFRVFERYDLSDDDSGRLTYADLGREIGMPVTQVTNHLAWARRELRRLLLDRLREITASDEEFRLESRLLLGFEPPSS
jgi:RNA polymerase sigma factor (sigma-70 family)